MAEPDADDGAAGAPIVNAFVVQRAAMVVGR